MWGKRQFDDTIRTMHPLALSEWLLKANVDPYPIMPCYKTTTLMLLSNGLSRRKLSLCWSVWEVWGTARPGQSLAVFCLVVENHGVSVAP